VARKKRKLPPFLHQPVYALVRSLVAGVGAMPIPPALATARAAARAFAAAPFNRTRLERATANLAVAFPDWSADQRRECALHAYEHLFSLGVETAFVPRLLTEDGWPRLVELGDLRPGLAPLLKDQPCVMITGHCGNWELLGYTLALLGFPVHALYRPLDLKPLDAWVRKTRQRRGLVLVDKFGAGEDLPDIMQAGATPGFVADQNAGDRGLFVPFFGRLASTYKSIGLLAQLYRARVICGSARRLAPHELGAIDPQLGPLRYRLEIFDVIEPDEYEPQPDPLFYITARYRRAIEAMVRKAPEQYLWMHRYWKSRPRHEKLGKPLPSPLRKKLEALPWMTQAEMDQILHHTREDTLALARNATPNSAPDPEPTTTLA
jgi:KDO2-lipid IV(A) lauroyltransferase